MDELVKRTKTLKQERQDLLVKSERRLAEAALRGGGLTDAEKAADDADAARLEAVNDELKRLERIKRDDREAQLPEDRVAAETFNGDKRWGFKSLADFARSVRQALTGGAIDKRLAAIHAAPSGYMQENGTAGEGYMVPTQFRNDILEVAFDDEGILAAVSPEPTAGNAVGFIADESTPWGASGVQAYWRSEVGQMTPSKLATKGGLMQLHELYAFVLAGDELLEDAPRLNDRLTRKSGLAIRWKAEEAIVNGDGAGKPVGWMKAACLVTQSKESAQTADTINGTNIAKMFSRNLGMGRAFWMVNPDALPQLPLMTVGERPVYIPPTTGFTQAPGGFLFGRPVKASDHCASIGDLGDIQFIDPAGYYAAQKASGITFASSIHLYFDYGLQAFRWTFRLGGQPFLSAAVTPAKGSTTRSHFITLEAR